MSAPPYHIAAVANVNTNLYAGRRFIVLEQFTPVAWLELVRDQAITNALVVPTMLLRILESEAEKSAPSMQSHAYGGASKTGSVIVRAMDLRTHIDFVEDYCLSETKDRKTGGAG